jgi:hypothetical protein
MDDYILQKCINIPIDLTALNGNVKFLFSDLLAHYDPISLHEMDKVQLMNRVDTKFLIGLNQLPFILKKAKEHYRIVEIDGERISPYSSIYFDTEDAEMYKMHHNGKLNRYKVRMRSYVNSGDSFLEVKRKNNKGLTSKERVRIDNKLFKAMEFHESEMRFIKNQTPYAPFALKPHIQNFFQRITLVDKNETERVTLDVGLTYMDFTTNIHKSVDGLVIVEMKQDGAAKSHFRTYLNELHVLPGSISKYCLGMALTNPWVKSNRFKSKLRKINKITQNNHVTI